MLPRRCHEGCVGVLCWLLMIIWTFALILFLQVYGVFESLRWMSEQQWQETIVEWTGVVFVVGAFSGVICCLFKRSLRSEQRREQTTRTAQRKEQRERARAGNRELRRSSGRLEGNDRVQILNANRSETMDTPDVQTVLSLLYHAEHDAALSRDYDTAAISVRRIKFIHESSAKLDRLKSQEQDAVSQEDFALLETVREKEEVIQVSLKSKLNSWSCVDVPEPSYYSPTCCPPEDSIPNITCDGCPPPMYTTTDDEVSMGDDSDVERRGSRDSSD